MPPPTTLVDCIVNPSKTVQSSKFPFSAVSVVRRRGHDRALQKSFSHKQVFPGRLRKQPPRFYALFFDGFGLGCLVGIDVGHQLVAGDGFLGQQVLGNLVQQIAVGGEQFPGLPVDPVQ